MSPSTDNVDCGLEILDWATAIQNPQSEVYQAVRECFAEIRALTDVSGPVRYAEFHSTLTRFMEERLVRNPSHAENGVRVVDAMAARGLSFRYLFVIGLTDHVFPRHIREDGFFRDSARRFLEDPIWDSRSRKRPEGTTKKNYCSTC